MNYDIVSKFYKLITSDPAVSAKLQYPRKDKRKNLWKNLNVLVHILYKSKNLSMENIKNNKIFEKHIKATPFLVRFPTI